MTWPPLAVWIAVAVGGATGSVLRVAIAVLFARGAWSPATLLVNIVGSALLGALSAWLPSRTASPMAVAGLTAGLCGGFTTMSTLALETVHVWQGGAPGRAVAYAAGSLVCSVGAAALGYALGAAVAR